MLTVLPEANNYMNFSGKKIALLVIILVLLAVAVFFLIKKLNQNKAEPILGVQPFWANQTVNQGQPIDEEGYRQSLKQIVGSLLADLNEQAIIKSSQEKVLALAVPNQYRQLHLSLVLALVHLEKPEQFQQGQVELERILSAEDWLLTD